MASRCKSCGADASGNFCAECGAPLGGGPGTCSGCGAPLAREALYCSECGAHAAPTPHKPLSARLPWIASAAALVLFSVVIAVLVQRGSGPRAEGMPPTGGIDVGAPAEGGGAPAAAGSPAAGMPSAQELAAMTPRERADRLFERAMTEHEGGEGFERALFFADMALQAYGAVPPADLDADARFHVGLLQLLRGETEAASSTADEILTAAPDHLLGLILSIRVAEFAGSSETADDLRARMREVVRVAGGVPPLDEYVAHRRLIDRELDSDGAGPGGEAAPSGPPEGSSP